MKKYLVFIGVAALLLSGVAFAMDPALNEGMGQCRPHWRKVNNAATESHWDAGWEHCQTILMKFNEAQDVDARAAASAQENAAKDATKALSEKLKR